MIRMGECGTHMRILYFTHCCAKKDDSLKGTGEKVPPMRLYTATPTQRFMNRCIEAKVKWAIFSDKYAFVFPDDQIEWYNKRPSSVTEIEKRELFNDAFRELKKYDLAWFYFNPSRLHPLYRELVDEMRRRGRDIREITHLVDISWGAYMNKKLELVFKKMTQRSNTVLRDYFVELMPNGTTNLRFFSYGSNMNEGKFREDTRKAGFEFDLKKAEKRVLQGYKRILGNKSVNHGLAFTILPSEGERVEGVCHNVPIEGLKAFLKKEAVLSDSPSYELITVSVSEEDHPVLTLKGLKLSSPEKLDCEDKLKAFRYVSISIEGAKRWIDDYSDMTEMKNWLEKELCPRT